MATATTAPTGILSNIDLKDFDLNDLVKFLTKVGKRTPILSNLVTTQMGDATLDNYTPEQIAAMINIPGVKTGDTLDPAEVDRKREERQKALEEAKRNRAAGRYSEEVKKAAERGEYGDISKMIDIDPNVNQPKVEIFPELTEADKLPTTTAGGVINVNDLISRPIGGGFIPEETFTDLTYTPIPEIEDFTILTMANKNKDTVKIGNKVYPKDQTELKYRPDKIIDGVKVKGKGYRVVKEEFKDEGEKKRIADGQTIRKELPQFLEDNPAIKERLYTSSISGKPDLEKIQEYFKEEFNIDFKTKTYEKIISQEIGNRKKEGRTYGKTTTAINDFKKGLRQYAKDRYGETLSNEEVDRYVQDFRAGLQAEFPDQGTGEFYTDDQVRIVGNLIADTIFAGRYKDPSDIGFDQYLDSYVFDKKERTKEKLKKIEEGETDKRKFVMEIGHQGEMGSGDILFGEAADPARYSAQTREDNAFQQAGQLKHKKARAEGDVETMKKIEEQFKNRNIRAMYLDEDGFEVYIGADAPKGKLKDGGLVGISHLIRPL
jgi:hypothetical protein